ncbi:MAG: 3-deoxy-D-manno-octulosonic acid transferase [Planctomycetota bacterium]
MPFIVTWLLNAVYVLLLAAVSPLVLYRRIAQGKYRGGWQEKLFGQLTRRHPERPCLWFHAVSVGEVLQLQHVLDETAARYPQAELLITTTTDTGFDVAKARYPQHTVSYFPLDFSWAVNRALAAIRPSLVVLVELELWPNFIFAVRRQGIPLALINGRIGEKSFKGYSRGKPLLRRVLACFDVLAVQNGTYAERLRALGAPAERVTVTGNIKFDSVESNRDNPRTNELRRVFGLTPLEQVFIAGSTQEPEETYALETWSALRSEFPNLRLVLVPRHKERFEAVANLILQRGLPLIRRSAVGQAASLPNRNGSTDGQAGSLPHILLLDTLGELAACWGLADIAFVGGSLTNRGGQNMLEPGGYGAAVLFGPNTWNFRDVTEALLSLQAARVVTGPAELTNAVRALLLNPAEARRMGQAAREFVASQRGATRRTVELLSSLVADSNILDNSAHAA